MDRLVPSRAPPHPTRSTPTPRLLGARPARHWVGPVLLLVVLGLSVHLILPRLAVARSDWALLRQMRPPLLGLAALAQVLSYVGSGYLLDSIVRLVGQRISLARAVQVVLSGTSIGLVAGGVMGDAAASFRWLRHLGIRQEGALLSGWLPTLFNLGILTLLALLGIAELLLLHRLSRAAAIAFGTGLAILAGAAAGIGVALRHRARSVSRLEALLQLVGRIPGIGMDRSAAGELAGRLIGALDLLRNGGWRRAALGALANTGFDLLTLFLLFGAAGYWLAPGVLLTGYGLPLLIGKSMVVPGGLGLVEGTMLVLYNGLGVPADPTVLVILAYRVLSFWIPTLLGFPLAGLLERATSAR